MSDSKAIILLHFLPKMRSKDLWQNESGTMESRKTVKRKKKIGFENSSISQDDWKPGVGQFK